MTELQIVTSVLELVTSAEGVTNTSLSREQVADEIDTLRCRMMAEIDARSLLRNPYVGYTQTITNLKVERDANRVSYANIPRVFTQIGGEPAIAYIGGKDGKSPYRVITGDPENAVHDQFIGKMATVHYAEGKLTFKNVSPQYIKVVAVFEDPSDLELSGDYDSETSEYPLVAAMIDTLIGKSAESYIRAMYRVRPQPNTQTDLPGAGSPAK